MKKVNSVEFKGSCRKCLICGDVKIWDYPNLRKCPSGKNHKWRHIDSDKLTELERKSIDEQVEYDNKNVKHRKQLVFNSEEDVKRFLGK